NRDRAYPAVDRRRRNVAGQPGPRETLGLRRARAADGALSHESELVPNSNRFFCPGPARARKAVSGAGSGSKNARAARLPCADWSAAAAGAGERIRERSAARRLRARRRRAAGVAALRRALGAALAGPRALRRLERVSARRVPRRVAVSRLGDRRDESR